MPLGYTVSHSARLVIAIAKGEVASEEVSHWLVALAEQGALSYRKIYDATKMRGAWSDDVILSFATFSKVQGKFRRLGPLAIVARAKARAHVELFVRSATTVRPVRIFSDQHEALRWLNEPGSDLTIRKTADRP